MKYSLIATTPKLAITLCVTLLLASACSGSSSSTPPTAQTGLENSDDTGIIANDSNSANVPDDGATNDTTNEITTESLTGGESETTTPMQDPLDADSISPDPSNTDPTDSNSSVPDPMAQSSIRINFDIQVPAYQSNELQVRLVWGEKVISANWVGDEFWSAADDFPTDTEHLLIVTFSDANGVITLGSFETVFKSGTNASMSYQITADQFDTDRWDNDGNGVSNLDQLIATSANPQTARILLFSETRGFRHDSIADAVTALEELATSIGMQTDHATDSTGVFNDINLANYNAVVWVLTSGDVLNTAEQVAFENYIRSGGGYAGIHAASDTEYEWPWYGTLVGAYFDSHPEIQVATQTVENGAHPSTAHLNLTWTRTDEWYDYSTNPRAQVNVLLSLDENSYTGGQMGNDHPSAWYHDYDGGRSWYTGGGHTSASYTEPDFRAHLLGGLRYAAGIN